MQKMSNNKLFFMLFFFVVIFTIGLLHFSSFGKKDTNTKKIDINGVYLTPAQEIQDFQLTDNLNQVFTKQNLNGHWTMLFFGFTNCGMVCPTTMAALNIIYQQLAHDLPADQVPQVIMISVDPKRDTAQRINDYVHSFNTNFIGARGDIATTIALEKQLHITAAVIQSTRKGDDNYTITHSDEILLVNPDGKLQAYFSNPHDTTERMVNDYETILRNNSHA